MSCGSGKTCLTCAKAKIKCDKMSPKCGRCSRLGIECNAQLRGRGRPPNVVRAPAAAKVVPSRASSRAVTVASPSPSDGSYDESEDDAYEEVVERQTPRYSTRPPKAPVVQPTYMMIEAIKSALADSAGNAGKEEARIKYGAVTRWLLKVACCSGYETLHDDILNVAEVHCADFFSSFHVLSESAPGLFLSLARFVDPPFSLSDLFALRLCVCARAAQMLDLDEDILESDFEALPPIAPGGAQVPNFVAALSSSGSGFLVQASQAGASSFFVNDDMAVNFVTVAEAEAVYASSGADPDAVLRRLVATRDRPAYLRAVADLLVRQTDLLSETSLLVHINARRGPPTLCLMQMRASFSPDGDAVVFGYKLIPMPDSDYKAVGVPAGVSALAPPPARHLEPAVTPGMGSGALYAQQVLAQAQASVDGFAPPPPVARDFAWAGSPAAPGAGKCIPCPPPAASSVGFGLLPGGGPAGAVSAASATSIKRGSSGSLERGGLSGRGRKRQSIPSSRYSSDCFATAGTFERMTLGAETDGAAAPPAARFAAPAAAPAAPPSGLVAGGEAEAAVRAVEVNPFEGPDLFAEGAAHLVPFDDVVSAFEDAFGPSDTAPFDSFPAWAGGGLFA